jgi:hypothetical protein
MTVEAASQICTAIAHEVRACRLLGDADKVVIGQLVADLCTAPATTAEDALALSAVARRLLGSALADVDMSDIEALDARQHCAVYALVFLQRAVEVLESSTGLSAEGFTGEVDAPH